MKTVYLDTNILLTLLRHAEDEYNHVIELAKQKHLNFVTGTITIPELSSVLSREYDSIKEGINELEKLELESLTVEEQIKVLIRFLLEWFHTTILEDLSPEPGIFVNTFFRINPIFKLAYQQSYRIKLRSLDNIHFATARLYDEFLGRRIYYLVTSDRNFLSKRAECQAISKILVINPQTLADLECEKP